MGRKGMGWASGAAVAVLCISVLASTRIAGAESLCAFRTESGALVYTNTPTKDGLCASASKAPPIGPASAGAISRYDPVIKAMADRYGVSSRLVHAVISTESAYNAGAVSPKGARGLMQLMPQTAKRYGVSNMFDASENIRGGVAHLRDLLDAYGGDTRLAVAAYNAGQGAVDRHSGIPPYAETREYVKRVMGKLDGRTRGLSDTTKATIPSSPVVMMRDAAGNVSLVN